MHTDLRLNSLYNELNQNLFNNELPHSADTNFRLGYSPALKRAYGNCKFYRKHQMNCYWIKISQSIFSFRNYDEFSFTPGGQLLNTLIHEMCHLYMYVTKGLNGGGHGSNWQGKYLEVTKKYNEIYDDAGPHNYARKQISEQYGSCHNKENRIAADGSYQFKYDVTCPVCGFHNRINRLGKNYKLALEGKIGHRNSSGVSCSHKLQLKRNR